MKKFKMWTVDLEKAAFSASVAISIIFTMGIIYFLSGFELPTLVMVVLVIAAFILIVFFTLLIWVGLGNLYDIKYMKESNKIIRRFNETKDAAEFYNALLNVKNSPKTLKHTVSRCTYLSRALDLQGRPEEALQLLDEIHAESNDYKGAVEKLRAAILSKAQGITEDEACSRFADLRELEVGSLGYADVFGSVSTIITLIILACIVLFSDLKDSTIYKDPYLPVEIIGSMALAAVLRIFIGPALDAVLRGRFRKESWEITSRFHETQDAAQYYNALVNMKNPPRFSADVNTRYISLSTALLLQGRPEEALQMLDKMRTKNKELRDFYEKRRAYILSQIHDSAENTTD